MTIFSPTRTGRHRLTLIAVAVIGGSLGGCDHLLDDRTSDISAGSVVLDPTQRHPIMVSEQPHRMSVRVARGDRGLSPAQRAAVIDFLNRSKASDGGNSKLVIAVPSGSPNEIAAMNAVADIRPILGDAGFSESAVSIEPYYADGNPQPPLRISYIRYVAEGPTCGKWPTNVAETSRNLNYEDFGCAQQKNLAAMVANPADLLGPRTMTPANADRRDTTYNKYVKGESSGSTRNGDERAATGN